MYLLNFLGVWNWICKKWFPYFLARFTVMYNKHMASKKRELFSNLQEFAGPSGKLSLLELGCGTGANFKFYPPGCRVTCIDPNPNFEKFLVKSIAQNRHLEFERFVVAAGENTYQVADGSMDVVVCTLVLCSVKNQKQILQEVRRVQRPLDTSCWKPVKRDQNALVEAAFSQPASQLPQPTDLGAISSSYLLYPGLKKKKKKKHVGTARASASQRLKIFPLSVSLQ
ncbi:thiol S-methyltransferase TMT1A-like isoform X1 [Camelus bactrianus]|uniref:Thiol S-methyltransferase TMT1A-like isoform X1 n=1 Tax=Camelus bactrianus TaxID=9837 RepID=A0AC58R8S9_CAMBA